MIKKIKTYLPGLTLSPHDVLIPSNYSIHILSLVLSTISINILSLALPIMTLQVYDRILPNPGSGTLFVLIMGVCLALILETILHLSRSYLIGRSGASFEHRVACNAMNKQLGADLRQKQKMGIGEHLHRMGSVGRIKDFYNGQALVVYIELLFIPLFIALIAYIGGLIVFVPLSILFVFCILSLIKGHALKKTLISREEADNKRFNFLIEALEGIHTLKAFALENFFQRRYEALEEKSSYANYTAMQETSSIFNASSIFSHIMVASVITVGAWFVLKGYITSGTLIATLLLSGRLMQPVQKGLALWTRYQDFNLARKQLENLMLTPQKQYSKPPKSKPYSDGNLVLENVSYNPLDAKNPLFSYVNLKLTRGDVILLSGDHGSGKTLLFNLISGVLSPTSGTILIDSHPAQSYTSALLSRHVGFVRTHSQIFRGTIRDNITCFGQVNEGDAYYVCSLLRVDEDVAKLPHGFDTFLQGNNADIIPPGLRQRIGIVRALAPKPRLILFDNADRSLDQSGYHMIYNLLAQLKGKATLLLISEDHNIQALADQHFIFKNSRLFETNDFPNQSTFKSYEALRL